MITFLGLLSVALFIALIITLFIGLIKPALVLRWTKKPTRLKVFGYWVLSMIIIVPTIGLLVSLTESEKIKSSTIIVEETLNYGIITQEKDSEVIIDAYYDAEIYKRENIAKVLQLITETAKEENPYKIIIVHLFSSKENKEFTNGTDWMAKSVYNVGKENKINIDYSDAKIKRLNTTLPVEYIELDELLKNQHNTSVCEVGYKMAEIFNSTVAEAEKKFGKKHPPERIDFEIERERKEITKLFAKYNNIPDSLENRIFSYLLYCNK